MRRYFVQLSFLGTAYFGWQVQPGKNTVQKVLEECFSLFLRQKIPVTGAGRTDTGVHASCFVAHFEVEELPYSPEDMVHKLNSFLPEDIALQKIWQVPADAHARFSAISRTYQYIISRVKDPFLTGTSMRYLLPLEITRMNEAAALLKDYSDFTSFCKLHSDVKTNFCRVLEAKWESTGSQLVFTITADRFLRNMVRAIAGTLIEVGKGKLSVDEFRAVIEKRDRCAAGTSVPARGLFLTRIQYPEQIQPASSTD
jgi:tRNA pseudouridine38-40 synthase